jgi:hypothetical protein
MLLSTEFGVLVEQHESTETRADAEMESWRWLFVPSLLQSIGAYRLQYVRAYDEMHAQTTDARVFISITCNIACR